MPPAWLRSLTPLGRALALLALVGALIWAGLFVRSIFVGTAEVEADIATGQADAAIESGKDAVDTVGTNEGRADDTRRAVEGATDNVEAADDAAGADRAGRDGLCVHFGLCDEE